MTIDELIYIKNVILWEDRTNEQVILKAIEIINRELNCWCVRSGNPACPIHGVAAQLERSQSE